MRISFTCLFLLLVPLPVTADVFGGFVVHVRQPTDKDDGLLIVKMEGVGKRATGEEVRIVSEQTFVFARHVTEGKHLPQHDKVFRKKYCHKPGDAKVGMYVALDYKVDAKGRGVIQGMRFQVLADKKVKDRK